MAIINSTQVKVLRTVVSTTPTATAGQVDASNHAYDVPKNNIRYELIKENMGDTPDVQNEYEYLNVGKVKGPTN